MTYDERTYPEVALARGRGLARRYFGEEEADVSRRKYLGKLDSPSFMLRDSF